MPRDGGKVQRSRKQEDRIAKQYRGSRSVASGALWFAKNDVRTEHLLIEAKRTDNVSQITLKADDLEELDRNAAVEGRAAMLIFDLNGREYCVLRSGFARELMGMED